MTFRSLAMVVIWGMSCTCASSAPPPPTTPAERVRSTTDEFARSLDAYFTGQMPPDEPGGAVLVMKDERTVFSHGYGLADLQSRQPITPRTLLNLGSISKTFVANAIL